MSENGHGGLTPLAETAFPRFGEPAECLRACGRQAAQVVYGSQRYPGLCEPCLADAEREAELAEVLEVRAALVRSAGTVRLREWSFATYPADADGDRAVERARRWLAAFDTEPTSLFIHGPVGCGKTGLAWCIVRELIETRGVPAALVNLRDLLAAIRASFDSDVEVYGLERVRTGPVVALDDLGAERPTDWAREQLSAIVDARYENRRPTIVTSNYGPKELGRRIGHDDSVIGDRIVSRLLEDATVLVLKGKDRRVRS